MMRRLLATATAAHSLLFSPTPGVLVLSPALTGPRTTFSVGPHAGESYERVWREDPQFCVWALEQPAPRAELEDFQTWLRSKSKARRAPVKPTNSTVDVRQGRVGVAKRDDRNVGIERLGNRLRVGARIRDDEQARLSKVRGDVVRQRPRRPATRVGRAARVLR